MRSRWWPELWRRAVEALPAAAVALAEGAWIAVVYAALQVGLVRSEPWLGVWAFVIAAGVGVFLARRHWPRRPRFGVPTVLVLTIAFIGSIGWAADPVVRALVADGSIGAALTEHRAGWLLALAAWRGMRHGDAASDDLVVATALTWLLPALALPWMVGSLTASREAFVDEALPATILFVAASLLAIGLVRLDALCRSAGVDWQRNRAWLWLLGILTAVTMLAGAVTAALTNASPARILQQALGPIESLVRTVQGALTRAGDTIAPVVPIDGTAPGSGRMGIAVAWGLPDFPAWIAATAWICLGLLVTVAVILLARRIRSGRGPRSSGEPADVLHEERHVRLPRPSLTLPRVGRPRIQFARRLAPDTASRVYLALLADLEGDDRRARQASESPATHARRLRVEGVGSLALDLLAADFVLERYGCVRLRASEVTRAPRRRRMARGPHVRRQRVSRRWWPWS